MAKRKKKFTLKEKKELKKKGVCWKCSGPISPKSKSYVCELCEGGDGNDRHVYTISQKKYQGF